MRREYVVAGVEGSAALGGEGEGDADTPTILMHRAAVPQVERGRKGQGVKQRSEGEGSGAVQVHAANQRLQVNKFNTKQLGIVIGFSRSTPRCDDPETEAGGASRNGFRGTSESEQP